MQFRAKHNHVFFDANGVIMNYTAMQINGLKLLAKIRRHSSPNYQTQLVSS